MTTTTPESIAQNLIRFFILIVFEAGIFSGIASAFLLGNMIQALVTFLIVVTLVACGVVIWIQKTQYIGKEVIENAARGIAKIFLLITFVAGIILGIGIQLLVGVNVVTLVAILFGVLLVMGVVLFKEFLLGEWWK